MVYEQHVYHKWDVFVIVLFYVLPKASSGYIQCGFINSAVWRFCNKFSCSFRCRKLALTRETSYIFDFISDVVGRDVGGCQASGYGTSFVCVLGHQDVSILIDLLLL